MVADELLTGWLSRVLDGVAVASTSPAEVEQILPIVVVSCGGGGDIDDLWLEGLEVDVDVLAAPDAGSTLNDGWSAASRLAERVDDAFRNQTPAQFGGHSLSLLTTRQRFIKTSTPNTAVRQMSAAYYCSTQ